MSRITLCICLAVVCGQYWANAVPLGTADRLENYLKQNGRDLEGDLAEDAKLNTLGLVAKYGYEGEDHVVQTEDGYLLHIHRIKPNNKCTTEKRPVFLQHGLLSSSADWVVMGPGSGLAYILSDACYDVWMGNYRGNTYSRGHTSLDPDSTEYWSFSWHEMGLYDLPTMIDYVLYRTQRENIYYIGHSQGTTAFFVMTSLKPEYNDKVRAMFAMAPIAFMEHAHSTFLTLIAEHYTIFAWIAEKLGMNQLLPSSDMIADMGGKLCDDEHPNLQDVCSNVIFAMCGYNEAQMNKTMLPVIMAHTPAGSATKQFIHYAQLIKAGKFQQYDYGSKENQVRYGQKTPPEYPLNQIKTSIALHYSDNDYFAAVEDVKTLYDNLPNSLGMMHVADVYFNHLDYMWAIDAKEMVYDKVISVMDRST